MDAGMNDDDLPLRAVLVLIADPHRSDDVSAGELLATADAMPRARLEAAFEVALEAMRKGVLPAVVRGRRVPHYKLRRPDVVLDLRAEAALLETVTP
jgi:hypothetical protein